MVWLAGAASVATVVPRTLGPIWLALIGVVLAVFIGRRRLVEVVRDHRLPISVSLVLVVLATLASASWSAYAGLFAESPDVVGSTTELDPLQELSPVVWTLQIVGAFPFRNTPAPTAVYAIFFLVVLAFLWVGARSAQRFERVAIIGSVVATIALPVLLTLATASSQGVIWQGRYQLPFVVGILVMCGICMDRRNAGRLACDAALFGSALIVIAHVWSVVGVAVIEANRTDVATNPSAIDAPLWTIGAIVGMGVVALVSQPLAQVWVTQRHTRPPAGGIASVVTNPHDQLAGSD